MQEHHRRGDRNANLMTAHVFLRAIRNRVRTRADRLMVEIVTQIIAQGCDRCVAFCRLFFCWRWQGSYPPPLELPT